MVLLLGAVEVHARVRGLRWCEQRTKVEPLRLPVDDRVADVEHLRTPDHLVDRAEAELRHYASCVFGDHEQVVHDVLGLARELLPKLGILRRHTDRAGVEVALAHHDAAERDERRRREAEFFGAEERCDDDVAARLELAIRLQDDAAAQVVEHERLMGLGDAELPR